jgi:hypothetical protein
LFVGHIQRLNNQLGVWLFRQRPTHYPARA